MPIMPSLQLIKLLEELIRDWNEWEKHKDYYLKELLPSLQNNRGNNATAEERRLMSQIRGIATTEEWENLGLIITDLKKFKAASSEVSKSINDLFQEGKFKEAELVYGNSWGEVYSREKQKYTRKISILIENYINDNKTGLAEAEFERYVELFSTAERTRLSSMIKDAKTRESKEKHDRLLQTLRNSIIAFLRDNYLESAWKKLSLNRAKLSPSEYDEFESLIQAEEKMATTRMLHEINKQLASFNYAKAENLYSEISAKLPRSEFESMLTKAKAKEARFKHLTFVESQKKLVVALLREYRFEEAEQAYQKVREDYSINEYQILVKQFRKKFEEKEFIKKLELLLQEKKFRAADQTFLASDLITEEQYLQLKSTHIKNALKQYNDDIQVSNEQAMALAHFNNRLLVKARAGSGKTRLLTAKTFLLIDNEEVHPDHIMIMAFNRDAANTVKTRVKNLAKTDRAKEFENARTFHSLAYQIVRPSGKLLFDEKGEFVRKAFSEFVQSIFREIATPELLPRLYEFFRREMTSAQSTGTFLRDNDYYIYLRNQRYYTLRGEKVKSIGEKFIADFLFEHNINYAYEKDYLWDGRIYHPDFTLFVNGNEFIIEHWGIDENDPNKSTPEGWHQGWDGYYAEMQRKREYWGERSKSNEKKNFILIETSVADLKNGRAVFEDILKSKLTNHGIVCKKLSEKERIQKVFRRQIDRMTNLLVQFILKAKKKRWNAAEVERQIAMFSNTTAKTRFFLELGCMVYKAYEEKIQREGRIDFDELVNQAVQRIHSSKANLLVPTDGSASRQFNLSNLEWLLIDEYQDFSPLFHDLVDAIQKYNPNLKLLCVGDDWQAINSFAGSDLSYFTEYQSFFPNARVVPLTTNYRSKSAIVDAGNKIMQGTGDGGKALPGNTGGNVYLDDVEAVEVQYKRGDKPENNPDVKYLFFGKTQNGSEKLLANSFMIGKYLKACHNIISNEKNRSKSFAILNRTNQIYGIDLADFETRLKSILREQARNDGVASEPNIKISTVHSFKGLEADCVILLQACQGYFPSLHPDNKLFEIFGQTERMVLEEEKRLFYVAVTRARESLFILTEGSRKSDFLSSIQAKSFLGLEEGGLKADERILNLQPFGWRRGASPF